MTKHKLEDLLSPNEVMPDRISMLITVHNKTKNIYRVVYRSVLTNTLTGKYFSSCTLGTVRRRTWRKDALVIANIVRCDVAELDELNAKIRAVEDQLVNEGKTLQTRTRCRGRTFLQNS
jgi:hypothetical protein